MRRGLRAFESVKDFQEPEFLDDLETDFTKFLNSNIRMRARRGEGTIVAQLEQESEKIVKQIFGHADTALEIFYRKASVVDQSTGEYHYNFAKLDAVDLEDAVLTIQREIYLGTDILAKLYSEVYLAWRVQEDEQRDAYSKPMDGTAGDRQSVAHRATRDQRYYFYYKFLIWKRLQVKIEALKDILTTLTYYRSRQIREKAF